MKEIKENKKTRKLLVYHELSRTFEIWSWSDDHNTYASYGCNSASFEEIKRFCDELEE